MRWDVDRALAEAGAKDALVFVHESWGAQILARLWALGVTRPESERLYRNVDLCLLDRRVTALEAEGTRGDPFPALAPAMADSARLVSMAQVPDTTARVLPGTRYGPECVDRIRADLRGIALLPPVLLSRRSDVVVVRDLGARDTVMLDRYPDRPVYLVRRLQGTTSPSSRRSAATRCWRWGRRGRPGPVAAARAESRRAAARRTLPSNSFAPTATPASAARRASS